MGVCVWCHELQTFRVCRASLTVATWPSCQHGWTRAERPEPSQAAWIIEVIGYNLPKGPFRPKGPFLTKIEEPFRTFRVPHGTVLIVWRVNSVQAVKFGTEIRKRYGDCSEMLVFPRKRTEKRYGQSKTTAVAKYYGFQRRSI